MFSHGKLVNQKGQAIVEHIILWPALVFVVLGSIQLTALYRDKATLNDVVFRAAREGALKNAQLGPMHIMMVKGLVPLYLPADPNVGDYLLSEAEAYVDNQINPRNGNRIGSAPVQVQIISPNRAVFDAFSTNMFEARMRRHGGWVNGCEQSVQRRSGNDITRCSERSIRQIPNDNLNIRSTQLRNVRVAGENVQLNLQDANLLKIRGHWCAPLSVPLVRSAFYHTLFRLRMLWQQNFWWFHASKSEVRAHPHWGACQAKTARNAALAAAGVSSRVYYIPISSDAVIRMQSPVRM